MPASIYDVTRFSQNLFWDCLPSYASQHIINSLDGTAKRSLWKSYENIGSLSDCLDRLVFSLWQILFLLSPERIQMLYHHIPLLTITYHYLPHIYHLFRRCFLKLLSPLGASIIKCDVCILYICVFSLDSTEIIDLFIDLNEQCPSPPTYQASMSE